jgi:hypothetical protein
VAGAGRSTPGRQRGAGGRPARPGRQGYSGYSGRGAGGAAGASVADVTDVRFAWRRVAGWRAASPASVAGWRYARRMRRRCSCKVATVRAIAGVCLACGGFILPAEAPHHAHPPVAVQMAALPADRPDLPHPPDRDTAQAVRADTAPVATVAGALTLDDPVLGRLDYNPLA